MKPIDVIQLINTIVIDDFEQRVHFVVDPFSEDVGGVVILEITGYKSIDSVSR